MIKYLKYMFIAAIVMVAATGCQEDPEDTFSTSPKAPELVNNGTILMTQNTMSESIKFAWSAARFTTNTSYALYAQYEDGTPIQVGGSTNELSLIIGKTEFQNAIKGLSGIPQNNTFSLKLYVVSTGADGDLVSEKQTITVYSYGDAVSAVVTADPSTVVLDVTDPTGQIDLLTWEPARLTYNEAITYNVYIQYGDNEAVQIAKDLTSTSYGMTVDEWNEAVISAGGPEAESADVKLYVSAFSETYPDGVPSVPVNVNFTTYVATYPAVMYLPGSYQGWDPATSKTIPQSTLTKGYYEAFFDLSTENGSDVAFKFSPNPAWVDDFGFEEVTVSTEKGFAVVSSKVIGSSDIKVPSGMYRIALNKKLNTLEMEQINTVGLIGDATPGGWSEETKMTFDAESMTYSVVTNMLSGKEYKFRINDDWDYAIAGNGTFSGGNFSFDKADGEYKIVLDVSKHPYTVKVLSTSYPERLYLPGGYQGWDPASAPTLEGDGEGHYEGAVDLSTGSGTSSWKFSPKPAWDGDFAGTITLDENGYGEGIYGGGGNIDVPDGYYYITVDMTEGTFTLRRIDTIGVIGGFPGNNWGSDVATLTYNKENNVWQVTGLEIAEGCEFKLRMNSSWDCNRGLIGDAAVVPTSAKTVVVNNGGNMKVSADGTYSITLDLSTNPNTIIISK